MSQALVDKISIFKAERESFDAEKLEFQNEMRERYLELIEREAELREREEALSVREKNVSYLEGKEKAIESRLGVVSAWLQTMASNRREYEEQLHEISLNVHDDFSLDLDSLDEYYKRAQSDGFSL